MHLRLLLLFALAAGRVFAADAKAPAPAVPPPATAPATKPASAAATGATFNSFRLVTDRNIFNPNRTGARRDRGETVAPPRLDVITLVGTMDSDKGLRAFFDGSEVSFRKVLRVGESVDKFKITTIAPQTVDVELDGKTFSVRVGQQLRRPEGAEWTLAADTQPRGATMAAPSRVDPNAPAVIPADADDVTRRLMERRLKSQKN